MAYTYTITYRSDLSDYQTITDTYTSNATSYTYTLRPATTFTKIGYKIIGWIVFTDEDDNYYTPGAKRTVYSTSPTIIWRPKWQYASYTVTYNANGGTGAPGPQTKLHDDTLTLRSAPPTRTGYSFLGWATSSAGAVKYQPGGAYTANASVTLYAVWSQVTYSVTYNANGGSGAPASQTKKYGVTLTLSSARPTWAGHKFVGWGIPIEGVPGTWAITYQPGDPYTANAAVTLYAVWTTNPTVTVEYNANGGTGTPASQSGLGGTSIVISSSKPEKANITQTFSVTYDKVRTGATGPGGATCTRVTNIAFDHWNTKADGSGTHYNSGQQFTLPINTTSTTITLYAIYLETSTGSVVLPEALLEQYALDGWATSLDGSGRVGGPGENYVPSADITLYAVWRTNGYGGMLKFQHTESLDTVIQAGDKVRLVNMKDYSNEGVYTVAELVPESYMYIEDEPEDQYIYYTIYFVEDFQVDGEQNAEELQLEIYGDGNWVPDMDYICSCDNRLFGCSTRQRYVFASALGDPMDFYSVNGNSLDAWNVPVGSAGDFTGCCALGSTVLFFKADCIHKLMGSYPSEYALYTYDTDGVSPGNAHSLQVCDGTAFFVTEKGIGAYSGASTGVMSRALGEGHMHDAIAGFNGNKYGLSYRDDEGNVHTYIFDLRYGIWVEADYDDVMGWAHLPEEDYILVKDEDRNAIYRINTGLALDDDWEIVFRDFIEIMTGSWNSQSMIFEKHRYTALTFRLELPKGSWIQAEMKTDSGAWRPVARLAGRVEQVVQFKIRTPRCDSAQLKLNGHGPMKILGIDREIQLGSRR